MVVGVVAGLLAALLYGAPAALQAQASRALPSGTWWQVTRAALADRLLLTVVACDVLGACFHYLAILRLPLYLAQSLIATSLLATALTSARLLHERLSTAQWWGLALVVAGLVLLALGAGRPGRAGTPGEVLGGLLVGAAVLGALLLVLRSASGGGARSTGGPAAGIAYAVLAGASYGAVPIGVRLVVAPYLRWQVLAALSSLAVFGLLGFACYSLAMQRAPVAAAGAPLGVTETLVPSIAGVVVFGDRVRSGWDAVVVLGAVLALTGIAAVSAAATPVARPGAEPERVHP